MFVLTELVNDIEDAESPYVKLVGVYDRLEDAQHVMQDRFRDAIRREIGDDYDDDDCSYEDVGFIYDNEARIDGEFVIQVFNIFDTDKK
mgnify:CR=1 FL=1